MADKKITALTEMLASGKDDSVDLLHIIDYSASPVNKKIKLANLFSTIETPITAYGAHTHDLGPTSAISGLSVVIPNVVPANSAETEVIVNDDGSAWVDFRIQTSLNDKALFVDSSLDSGAGNCNTITINGGTIDAAKKVDFNVNSSTGVLLHTDSTDHVVGVGTAAPDTAYLLDVAAVAGKSIKAAGTIDVTGSITATADLTTSGLVKFNQSAGSTLTGGATGARTAIPVTTLVSHLNVDGTTNKFFTLADGVQGQIKILVAVTLPNSGIVNVFCASSDITSIDMNAEGESCTLLFTNSKWYMIGNTTGVVATGI